MESQMRFSRSLFWGACLSTGILPSTFGVGVEQIVATSKWEKFADGPWSAREGLMAVETPEGIVMTGGRAFFGARAEKDVWLLPLENKSSSQNTDNNIFQNSYSSNSRSFSSGAFQSASWQQLPDAPYKDRAYHAMFYFKGCIFVMGGQTVAFLGNPFYNDVWKSCDGGHSWKLVTSSASWPARAGIAFSLFNDRCSGDSSSDSSITGSAPTLSANCRQRMIVAGGCYGASIGSGRKFLNDVWASEDGEHWELLTEHAEWAARSGARLVEFQNKLLLIAGEIGFTPDTQFGDVWESVDGKSWTQLLSASGSNSFSKRSGHGVVVAGTPGRSVLYLIAGWHDNKCIHDLWSSPDGASWRMLSNSTWDCESDACGKFDFWPLAVRGGKVGYRDIDTVLLTFGGSASYSTFGKMWADSWALPLPSESGNLNRPRTEISAAPESPAPQKGQDEEVDILV